MTNVASDRRGAETKVPAVSVVIPLYNKRDYLATALRSVLSQTFTDYEIIIVNDGSTDGSEEAIAPFLDRVVLVRQVNTGAAAARNRGIASARGRDIAFLDADDAWLPDKLRSQVDYLASRLDVQWCGVDWFRTPRDDPREKSGASFPRRPPRPEDWMTIEDWFAASVIKNMTWTSGVMVRRSVFDSVGLFDERIFSGQDLDMWIRIALKYPRFGYLPSSQVYYNIGIPGSISSSGRKKLLSSRDFLIRHVDRIKDGAEKNQAYIAYMRERVCELIRNSIAKGSPDIARDALRMVPREWITREWQGLRLISLLPGPLLRTVARNRLALLRRIRRR